MAITNADRMLRPSVNPVRADSIIKPKAESAPMARVRNNHSVGAVGGRPGEREVQYKPPILIFV